MLRGSSKNSICKYVSQYLSNFANRHVAQAISKLRIFIEVANMRKKVSVVVVSEYNNCENEIHKWCTYYQEYIKIKGKSCSSKLAR